MDFESKRFRTWFDMDMDGYNFHLKDGRINEFFEMEKDKR